MKMNISGGGALCKASCLSLQFVLIDLETGKYICLNVVIPTDLWLYAHIYVITSTTLCVYIIQINISVCFFVFIFSYSYFYLQSNYGYLIQSTRSHSHINITEGDKFHQTPMSPYQFYIVAIRGNNHHHSALVWLNTIVMYHSRGNGSIRQLWAVRLTHASDIIFRSAGWLHILRWFFCMSGVLGGKPELIWCAPHGLSSCSPLEQTCSDSEKDREQGS